MMAAHLGGQAGCRMFHVPWERVKPVPAGGGNRELRGRKRPRNLDSIRPTLLQGGAGGEKDKTQAL